MTNMINPLWKAYNDVMNEGGEGYNPHEQFLGAGKGEPLWSKLLDKIARLQNVANATSDMDPRWKEMMREIEVLKAAQKDAMERNI
ncbi:hypothetical protein [Aromatoleum aromaticum]|uniref:hypothetical protein n=1 Tax=Aromatoleum aromaticum TaxID=551760 RepID=UPI001459AEDB|nr:hypothetical protein [Aromatoleum aromaticum]NMG56515.1 hypothetical protein [Aromatoleum aromaticum]